MRLIIVRKGALSTFRFLEQSCRDMAGLRVIWDRRESDRRLQGATPRDRKGGERRGVAPHSWTVADHILVACDELEPASELGLQDVNGQ